MRPDYTVRLTTPVCGCGLPLDAESGEVEQTYQVFDLPQPATTRRNGTSGPSKQNKKWPGVFEPSKVPNATPVFKASSALVVSINSMFSRNFVLSAAPLIYMSHHSGAKQLRKTFY